MSTHTIRQEKWETLRDHLETIADQLAEVQDIAEELREDYRHTDARLEKLDDLSVLLEPIRPPQKNRKMCGYAHSAAHRWCNESLAKTRMPDSPLGAVHAFPSVGLPNRLMTAYDKAPFCSGHCATDHCQRDLGHRTRREEILR